MTFGYDPEAVIQDADIEMEHARMEANEAEAMRKRGFCDHGWTGPLSDGSTWFVCHHCRRLWPSRAARDACLEALDGQFEHVRTIITKRPVLNCLREANQHARRDWQNSAVHAVKQAIINGASVDDVRTWASAALVEILDKRFPSLLAPTSREVQP